jgi:uncharacterized membrane protein (UPF0127 family)
MYLFSLLGYVPHHHRGHPLGLKVLNTPELRAKGFMGWNMSPNDHYGLLFYHTEEHPQSYWMHNVPFNLDILGFDKDNILIERMYLEAHSKASRSFIRGVRHVVEVRGGWCDDHEIKGGERLILKNL